jgi:hypothetical protein
MDAMHPDIHSAAVRRVDNLIRSPGGLGLRDPGASKHHALRMTATIRPNPTSGRAP